MRREKQKELKNERKKKIKEKIKQAIKEAGLTQSELGKKLNITHPLVNNWITGRRNPSLKSLKKIAKATNKPLNYFFDNSGNIQAGNYIYGGKTEFNNNQYAFELLQKENELLKRELEIEKKEKELLKKERK
jgi:transcriptional regulator with XRE-family HTH domain